MKNKKFLIPEEKIRNEFKTKGLTNFAIGAAILNNVNKILLIKRVPGDFLGNHYEMPGGEVANESFKECIIREVKEEVSLDVINILKMFKGFTYILNDKVIRHAQVIVSK